MNRGNLQVFALRITTKRPALRLATRPHCKMNPFHFHSGGCKSKNTDMNHQGIHWKLRSGRFCRANMSNSQTSFHAVSISPLHRGGSVFSTALFRRPGIKAKLYDVLNLLVTRCVEAGVSMLGARWVHWHGTPECLEAQCWYIGFWRTSFQFPTGMDRRIHLSERVKPVHALASTGPCRGDSPHTLPCKATTWTFNTVARTDHNCTASIPSARGNASSYTLEPKLLVEHKATDLVLSHTRHSVATSVNAFCLYFVPTKICVSTIPYDYGWHKNANAAGGGHFWLLHAVRQPLFAQAGKPRLVSWRYLSNRPDFAINGASHESNDFKKSRMIRMIL